MSLIDKQYDAIIEKMVEYLFDYSIERLSAYEIAKYCLMDSLGCAMLALTFPACTALLGPWVTGTHLEKGARVPGTQYELDPIKAAFDFGTMIRWLDFNDTWLAQEWGHPSDNIGGLLPLMDFINQRRHTKEYAGRVYTIYDLLDKIIRAYEIQGVLALENSFNRVGLDHVILVKIATVALATQLLGGTKAQVKAALSQAWVDGQSLRTYRHAPNTGSRKAWAAGDATSRGIRLAFLTMQGEAGYKSALSAPQWGFSDVQYGGNPICFNRNLDSYVIENILFKVPYPAEFHAQTAIECALRLRPHVLDSFEKIEKIEIYTQQAAMRIIDKKGKLENFSDRDHCLQYVVAVALLYGDVGAHMYQDDFANHPEIDKLRKKMVVRENPQFSKDYLNPDKHSITNEVHLYFYNGQNFSAKTEYPLGHKRRRKESKQPLEEKFLKNVASFYGEEKAIKLLGLMKSKTLLSMPVHVFMNTWIN